ncbi:MAG: hypothetical protein LUD00_02745 [Prevotellaceae bacterium]|nr:hypothetical protein [Prevotellaceae bacterium]
MKRLIFTLSLLVTVIAEALAQNDAMYVYRNDGEINAFLKSDVDSVVYSQLDVDSLVHSGYVVQEVWTVDSVYRIPLEVIDSVSFVTPKTVYKRDVTNLSDNLIDYIIGAENQTLMLKQNTPTLLFPQVGDKLVLLEGCDVLPDGFAGEVKSVNVAGDRIDVICGQVYIEDLFDSYCSVQTLLGYMDGEERVPSMYSKSGSTRAVYNPNDLIVNLGPYTASASGELSQGIIPNGELALKGGAGLSVTLEPKFRIHTFLIVGEGHGLYFSSSITGSLSVSSKTSIYGGVEWTHEFLNPVEYFPIPATAGLVNFYLNPGLFFRANALITSSITATRNYTFGMAFDYSSMGGRVINPSLGGRLASATTEMEGCMDGSVAVGTYMEIGFSLMSRELAKVSVRGEYGVQASGNFVLRNSDIDNADENTELYERLKASSVEYGPFVNASLNASVLNTGSGPSMQISRTDEKWNLVPTFSKTKLTHTPGAATSVDAYSELSGDCLFPVPVGYKLFDENRNEVADYEAPWKYTNTENRLEHSFAGLDFNRDYTVYPVVKIFGHDVLASPFAKIQSLHPQITNFKVTGSTYSKSGFSNEGRTYDYKFDAATTVEIESLDGVADWGYVYQDPYGNIKRISLMEHGTSYTDTRYAYCRNEAKSTACLYGYVQYEGDAEYYYGEPQSYPLEYSVHTCPDANHPHAIDLGLPSGTKWCCCNVGASSPEGYGGYYAWGETSEKSVYDRDTYTFYDSLTGGVNIGSDISGTQYDVAHVRMGAPWRMPSHEQQRELLVHCTQEWTQQNGVNGILVTGPNGGQVFLPAAGNRGLGDLYNVGSYGDYWSGSLSPDDDDYACYLLFGSDGWYWYDSRRGHGQSVRPVCL